MLETLLIQGIVLIEKLELHFNTGFTVLTGETGAGKSILLDAFGLALGERANAQFINPHHNTASVVATFHLAPTHPVRDILQEQGIEADDSLILRRLLYPDGKSRAYLNDQLVSLALLKNVGEQLVEIHGQFDHLLDAKSHLNALDRFGDLEPQRAHIGDLYHSFKQAEVRLNHAIRSGAEATQNQEFLKFSMEELVALNLQDQEEEKLRSERHIWINHTKIMDHAKNIFQKVYMERGVETLLQESLRSSQKLHEIAPDKFDGLNSALERALSEVENIREYISPMLESDEGQENRLEHVEERLLQLRAVARKHNVAVEDLPRLLSDMQRQYHEISFFEDRIGQLRRDLELAREAFLTQAKSLSEMRQKAALALQTAIQNELAPLKLEKARVFIEIDILRENAWNESGINGVEFKIQPNPGMPLGPLAKIASGGERSRFMLALKVILAKNPYRALLIFDEIDAGVGGAVSAAVGERMARLGSQVQVLAITHAPQVAACANKHWVVSKAQRQERTVTNVVCLDNFNQEREEEIARMLAGEQITPEARAAAAKLLTSHQRQ